MPGHWCEQVRHTSARVTNACDIPIRCPASSTNSARLIGPCPMISEMRSSSSLTGSGTALLAAPMPATAQGWVRGSVKVDGFGTPSVRYNSGALASLPTYRYHSSNLRWERTLGGDIVGSLTGDHCSHAVVWHRAAESSD